MKILILFLLTFSLTSCFSTKYSADKNQGDFSKIRAGEKYTFHNTSDQKLFLNVTSVEKDSIRGIQKKMPVALAKNDIKNIRRNNTAVTVLVAGGVVGTAILVGAIINTIVDVGNSLIPAE